MRRKIRQNVGTAIDLFLWNKKNWIFSFIFLFRWIWTYVGCLYTLNWYEIKVNFSIFQTYHKWRQICGIVVINGILYAWYGIILLCMDFFFWEFIFVKFLKIVKILTWKCEKSDPRHFRKLSESERVRANVSRRNEAKLFCG